MAFERNAEIPQGDQVALRFTLTVTGVGPWNVAGATSIRLGLTNAAGAVLAPVTALIGDVRADWSKGRVVVVLPASYTVAVQDIAYALTVAIGDEIVTPIRGVLTVVPRPGFVPP